MSLDQLTQARVHLTEAQLVAFLRAANKVGERASSVRILCGALENGQTLVGLFTPMDKKAVPPRYRSVVSIHVESLSPHQYRIAFGVKGKKFGDGGVWLVTYHPDGSVLSIVEEDYWWVNSADPEQ